MITPKNLVKHELIGLEAEVAGSTNKFSIGISGLVVDETKNTLSIETEERSEKDSEKRFDIHI